MAKARVTRLTIRLSGTADLGVETDCIHEDRKPKLTAAQPNKTTKAADWYAPTKEPAEEGTTDHSVGTPLGGPLWGGKRSLPPCGLRPCPLFAANAHPRVGSEARPTPKRVVLPNRSKGMSHRSRAHDLESVGSKASARSRCDCDRHACRRRRLMNEVKKLPSFGRRWRTHRREPQLFSVDALAAGVHAMIAGQLGGAN
jgi:hypothetical protein